MSGLVSSSDPGTVNSRLVTAEPWPIRAAQELAPGSGGNKASHVAALGRGARSFWVLQPKEPATQHGPGQVPAEGTVIGRSNYSLCLIIPAMGPLPGGSHLPTLARTCPLCGSPRCRVTLRMTAPPRPCPSPHFRATFGWGKLN